MQLHLLADDHLINVDRRHLCCDHQRAVLRNQIHDLVRGAHDRTRGGELQTQNDARNRRADFQTLHPFGQGAATLDQFQFLTADVAQLGVASSRRVASRRRISISVSEMLSSACALEAITSPTDPRRRASSRCSARTRLASARPLSSRPR